MSEHTNTTYAVQVTVNTPEEAGQVAAAAAGIGFTEIRYSAHEASERRPLNQDELGRTLEIVVAATDSKRAHEWDADRVIEALDAIGREDAARDLYGDERVDQWFRDCADTDPDVARSEDV